MCESPPADHARENCIRCNELKAEVAQLRTELDAMRTRHDLQLVRYGLTGVILVRQLEGRWTPWFIAEAVCLVHRERVEAAETARDHLRARLRDQVDQWIAEACELREGSQRDPMDPNLNFDEVAEQLGECAADLLAVLTEPEEKPA